MTEHKKPERKGFKKNRTLYGEGYAIGFDIALERFEAYHKQEIEKLREEYDMSAPAVCKKLKALASELKAIREDGPTYEELQAKLDKAEKNRYECTCDLTNPHDTLCDYCYTENAKDICKESVEMREKLDNLPSEGELERILTDCETEDTEPPFRALYPIDPKVIIAKAKRIHKRIGGKE